MHTTPLEKLIDLRGKAAIVTGGAKGIGYGIAYRLAEAGAQVLIADIDEESANQAARRLGDNGWSAHAIHIDVSSEEAIRRMINTCRETCGSIDILVNNAGIFPIAPITEMSLEDFERVIRINVSSVFLTTKYAAEIMKAQGGGKIINITSIDALHPSMVGLAHYDTSKHGVWGFTKNAALEFASANIQVNAIAPGAIQTPGVEAMQRSNASKSNSNDVAAQAPMGRIGEPDDIGRVVVFLASDLASYITGEQIVVDGGVLLS